MSRTALLGAFVCVAAGLSGCAAPARVIKQDQNQVVVAVPDNTNVWPFYYQDAAKEEAAKHISGPVLMGSTQVKVGEQMTNTQDVTRRNLGGQENKPRTGEVVTSSNTTTVSDKFEYHLYFQSAAPFRVSNGGTPGMSPPIPGGSPVVPAGGIPPRGAPAGADLGQSPFGTPSPSGATSLPTTPLTGPGR
jgi:hypothetical protein